MLIKLENLPAGGMSFIADGESPNLPKLPLPLLAPLSALSLPVTATSSRVPDEKASVIASAE